MSKPKGRLPHTLKPSVKLICLTEAVCDVDEIQEEADEEIMSPMTKQKFQENEEDSECDSPLGNILMYKKMRVDQESQKQGKFGGFSLNGVQNPSP